MENETLMVSEKTYKSYNIEDYYELKNSYEIYSFISNNNIKDFILETANVLKQYFNENKATLELVTDEEDNTWKTLFIHISDTDFDNFSNNLRNMFKNWNTKNSKEYRKLVTFSIL